MKTNVLFFTKGNPTEKIWYFDLSDVKVAKKTPYEDTRTPADLNALIETKGREVLDILSRLKTI